MDDNSSVFRPVAPPQNLAEELVSGLTEEITAGKLVPGERLPTEQKMIRLFGVSRTVVREAVSARRSEGLVETRQGAGAMRRRPRYDSHASRARARPLSHARPESRSGVA